MIELPSGSVTLLFTDIEGSTRLIEEFGEDGYVLALAEHRRLLRSAFLAHGGVEVDTQGDAFLYAFADPIGALAAATLGQQALASGQVKVRMGLHTGEVRLTSEGYAGRELHRAARIAASGHGGQVVLSAATRALVEADVTELGEHRLKDFDEPVALFQLGSERFAPLKTISNTNLPRPVSSFVGREREREELLGLLRNGSRLLTLSGPGGSGKTRLALDVASELVPDFKAGVFWVGLAALRDPALVMETVAQTLGAKDGLAEHISERELLLLLDNFEQVVEAAPELSRLLEACPNLRLLVTSRELLRIAGEVEYPVFPLAEPEAVELFCDRSRLEPDETLAELCRRLDDLPLAVELAAARTRVLTPSQILDRLGQRLDLLKGGRDADPRQRTLRATIEWSHDLLTGEEKQLFARLAVFAGGCTLEAAEDVCDADLDVLQPLVDKSLLRHTGDRFWMLETIREYALDRLVERPEADELRRRHADHFLALMETTESELRGPAQARWIERLDTEHDNLRAALRWLLDAGEADLGLRFAAASSQFWYMRGHVSEGRRWLAEGLELASPEASEARASGLDWAGYFAAEQGDDPIPLLEASRRSARDAGALATAALATSHLSIFLPVDRAQEMLPLGEEAVRLARASGVRWVLGVALNVLGETLRMAGNDDRATVMYEEGLVIRREMGDVARISLSLSNLSEMAFLAGDLSRAHALASEALDLARSIGDRRQMSFALAVLGWITLEEARPRESRELFVEGLELERALGTPQGAVAILHGLAGVAAATGDAARGARLEASARQLEAKLGAEIAHVPTIADFGPHEPFLNAARDATEHAAWERAWAVGAAMDLDEAIDSALSDD